MIIILVFLFFEAVSVSLLAGWGDLLGVVQVSLVGGIIGLVSADRIATTTLVGSASSCLALGWEEILQRGEKIQLFVMK